jgi:hypothetical protein
MNVAHDACSTPDNASSFCGEFESPPVLQRIANGTKNPSAGIVSLAIYRPLVA